MLDVAVTDLTFVIIIIILSLTAAIFFYTDPVRKVHKYKRSMNDFSAFFLLSAIVFSGYVFSEQEHNLFAIFFTNLLALSSFIALKQGFIQRKTRRKIMLFFQYRYLFGLVVVPFTNTALTFYFPNDSIFNSLILLPGIIFIVLSTIKYVAVEDHKESYGEKSTILALYMTVLFITLLLISMFFMENKDIQLSVMTITYAGVLVILMAAIQTMFLSDFADKYKLESNTDFLTGLYNRRYFIKTVQKYIKLSQRNNKIGTIIMIDIDDFKFINDVFGHDVGDEVLKEVSNTIQQTVRETDVVARLGGEEFCIYLAESYRAGAKLLAERLREKTEQLIVESEICDVKVTLSFGLCEVDTDSFELMTTLKHADRALYHAKNNGKNQVIDYDDIKHLQPSEQN